MRSLETFYAMASEPQTRVASRADRLEPRQQDFRFSGVSFGFSFGAAEANTHRRRT